MGAADRRFFVHSKAGRLTVADARAGVNASFSRAAVVAHGPGVAWSLGLRAVGRGSDLARAAPVVPIVHANQVRYVRKGVEEWYADGPLGLEQGFTLDARPPGPGGAPLKLVLGNLPANVRISLSRNRQSATLSSSGRVLLRYWGLFASDARGRPLGAWIETSGHRFELRVDDQDAVYPVRIDPFLQTGKLTASDGAGGDVLGASVAISGDTVVVGAPNAKVAGNQQQGAAYVFVKPTNGWASATETAKLMASDGASGDQFGYSVSISGDTVVVGAPYSANARGSAYVFVKPANGWTTGTETAKLPASTPAGSDHLGWSVAISGGTIAAGAVNATAGGNGNQGAAYVFVKPANGWATGSETAKLTASDGAFGDQFGYAVAVAGDTVVAGAPQATVSNNGGQGAAYVFVKPSSGWATATETTKLTSSDGGATDQFGSAVAVSGGMIAVGARGHGNQGDAYAFTMPAGGWGSATAGQDELTASDGASGDEFGYSVGIDSGTILIGAPDATVSGNPDQGAAYVFTSAPAQHPTSTSVSCTPPSANVGETTTCTAIVLDIASASPSPPTGVVTFASDSSGAFSNPGNGCTLAANGSQTAACSVDYTPNALGSGTHRVTGSYGGDGTHDSSGGHFDLPVGPASNRPTSSSASCVPSSIVVGDTTTCTATVTDIGTGDTTAPTGAVTFSSDSHGTFPGPGAVCNLSATATVGQASCQVSYTPSSSDSGTHTITTAYAGDGSHAGSSASTAVSVAAQGKRPSLTSISCSPSTVVVGRATTCTATVSDAGPGIKVSPTGAISFGTDSQGSFAHPGSGCALPAGGSGSAACSVEYTPAAVGSGSHTITATYSGDPAHTGSGDSATLGVSGPPPTDAQASFTLDQGSPQTFEPVQLDASASARPGSQVESYRWTITRSGYSFSPSTACMGQTPVLQTSFARAGTYRATVQVTDSLGAISSFSRSFSVAGGSATAASAAHEGSAPTASTTSVGGPAGRVQAIANSYARALASAPPTALCDPAGRPDQTLDPTGGGGPPAGCYQQQVGDGLVDAVGCFTQESLAELPNAEKRIVDRAMYHCLRCALADLPQTWLAHVFGPSQLGGGSADATAAAFPAALNVLRQEVETQTTFYVSFQPVRINGLDYSPAAGAAVVIAAPSVFDLAGDLRPYVISSNVTISAATDLLGTLPLRSGELELPIDTDREQIAFIPFNQSVPFLPGTALNGGVSVLLHQSSSEIVAQMALPDILRLSDDSSRRVTVTLSMTATNSDGVKLSGFGVQNIDAKIYGVLAIHIGTLSYDARTAAFEANDIVVDTFEAAGKFTSDLDIQGKRVTLFDIRWDSPPPGLEVAPAVHLASLFGSWIDNDQQTAFGGGATLTLGPAVAGCGIAGVTGDFQFQLFPLLQMTLAGDLSLACIPVGHEVVTIAEDGYAHFRASFDYELIKDVVSFSGGFDVTYYGGHFTAIADATGCAVVCAGGTGVISDKGVGLCLSLSTGPFHWHPGFGFDWPSPAVLAGGPVATAAGILANLQLISDSCGTGPWVTVNPRAQDAQAGAALFTLPRQPQGAVIGIAGTSSAPRVRLTGPDGQTIETPAHGVLKTGSAIAFSNQANRTTYVALFRPAAGTWRAQTLDGSTIASVRRAEVLPDPRVSGRVSGSGSTRLLSFRVQVPTGDDVRLFERAPGGTRQLAQVTHSGLLRFTPSDAAGSRRTILALVERHGRPITQLTIAHFRAEPPAIGSARRIRARLARGGLIVTWRPTPGAQGQTVDIVLSDGRSFEVDVGARTGSLRIRSVLRGEQLLVLIRGYRARGARHGLTARGHFRVN